MYTRQQMNEYMKARYLRRRAEAIKSLGGVCVNCSSVEDLQFHHKDKTTKIMTIAKAASLSEVRWQEELLKCELLCGVCHTTTHGSKFPCGTVQRYWRGCRCTPCKEARSAYNKEYRRKRSAQEEISE